ncbi:MAG: MXAN_5187 C-terminal domain-containing protein [Thermodesulfobacteriota bacterium]
MGVKEDLDILDNRIDRLKIEYEQYFMRILKREPLFLKSQINKTIAQYTHQVINNTGYKFRFRNLADKYNTFKQYWRRTLSEIENGTYRRRSEVSDSDARDMAELVSDSEKAEKRISSKAKGSIDHEFYDQYIDAKKKCLEPTTSISYEMLESAIKKRREQAAKKFGTNDLDFKVTIKDGKTKILVVPGKKT